MERVGRFLSRPAPAKRRWAPANFESVIMPIRVICTQCAAKLDIRDELAGSKRRCPKCKTEFVVPVPAEVAGEAVAGEVVASEVAAAAESPAAAVENSVESPLAENPISEVATGESPASEDTEADTSPVATPAVAATPTADEADDDDDLDYLPDFVTSSAEPKSPDKGAAKPPMDQDEDEEEDDEDEDEEEEDAEEDEEEEEEEDDDDGPVLSIPKLPDPPPKRKSFDPAFLESDADEDSSRKTPTSSRRGSRGTGEDDRDDFSSGGFDKSRSAPDFKLPPPNRGVPVSEPGSEPRNVTRDRAQAARELRQALKDSALTPQAAAAQRTTRGGFDFVEFMQEFGFKGLAIIIGGGLVAYAVYFASDYAMGKTKRPPLGYVTGTITMDGQPIPRAVIEFLPDNSETAKARDMKRTSTGVSDAQGKFTMFYEEGLQGVAVGKCRVMLKFLPPPFVVPAEYSILSTTLHDIAKGHQTIDIPLKSPQKK